ncbi:Hsp20/alpha crystallin family protein [Peptacetobacter hominis]|uniref:Hsp20/alpha crystallin family protein n=1 Tax=Peptacetobacter hominis TaxID=2743610 RepID=A0A544QWU3_9FIRM|nr:Hsp20/alpha crystallin family protein [Peptacetobacter hominis]TQQ85135.1 Hsp20/alpha crystallin family protein [Peptacetobacter hominis]
MMMPSIFRENLFDDLMDFSFDRDFWNMNNSLYGKQAKNMMRTDIKENENNYELDIDLPGFKKDEISAELKNGYLTVSATKNVDNDNSDDSSKYIRKERYVGSMCRSFYVGQDIKQEDIHAKFEDGILKLCVPKEDVKKVEQTNNFIQIEG